MMLALALLALSMDLDWGLLSVYRPGDGWNSGELSCGGRFTHGQRHIAYRGWRRMGCGRRVVVLTLAGAALTRVRDAGPFGVIRGQSWKPWPRRRPPSGWRWRCVVDLSWGLWLQLGRPDPLSPVLLLFLPRWLDRFLAVPGQLGLLLDISAQGVQDAKLRRGAVELPYRGPVDPKGLGHRVGVESEVTQAPGEELSDSCPLAGFSVVPWHGFLVKRPTHTIVSES